MPRLETLLLQLVMLNPQCVFDLVNLSHLLYSVDPQQVVLRLQDSRAKLILVILGSEQKLEVRLAQTRLLSRPD